MKNFSKDLYRGKLGEKAVKTFIDEAGLKFVPNENKNVKTLAKWDFSFKLDEIELKCEVKRDWMESKTGNIAIEYHNPKLNKPSGLLATTADLWFIVLESPRTLWVASVEKLKGFCEANKPLRDIKLGGDDNASLWLYPSKLILPECFVELTSITDLRKLLA